MGAGIWSRIRGWATDFRGWLGDWLSAIPGEVWKRIAQGALVVLALYYPIGMMFAHRIDDNPDFTPPSAVMAGTTGGSAVVGVMVGLIDREVNTHGWVLNDPFFKPAALLDNMPNYQQGIFASFARFTIELRDQIGRSRGSSAVDEDLEEAGGLLPYPGDVWIFNFKTSLLPTASAERQYLRARKALINYNIRLAGGEAVFERRSDNLQATLDRIALDVGASSAALHQHIVEHSDDFLDFGADDLFYNVKGQAYGYYMILRALEVDFADVIRGKELSAVYAQMLDSFRALALLDPLVVTNNAPDDQFLPNHLAAQGFYLLRARTQLREITNILLK